MKRNLILVLGLIVCFSVAYAVEGLSAGFDFRITDFDAEEMSSVMGIQLDVLYEMELMDGALELDFGLALDMYNFDDDDALDNIYLNIEGRYFINEDMNFILGLDFNFPMAENAEFDSELLLGFRMFQQWGTDMWFQFDLPINFLNGYDNGRDPFDYVQFNLTWDVLNERKKRGPVANQNDGFGGQLKLNMLLNDGDNDIDDFLRTLYLTPYWSAGAMYAELEIAIPMVEDGIKAQGIDLTPKFEMDLPFADGLSFDIRLPIRMVGNDLDIDPIIGLGIGVNYKF
jgi:hypothetical protein